MYFFINIDNLDDSKISYKHNGYNIGYFETNFELENFKRDINIDNLFKISDIYIGNVIGDEYYIIEPKNLKMDMYCLSEIVDFHKESNFDKIVYFKESCLSEITHDSLIYVNNPKIVDNKRYVFNNKYDYTYIKEKNSLFNLFYEEKCKLSKGFIQLYEYNEVYYNVYKNDTRSNKINVIESYENLDIAKQELVSLSKYYKKEQKNKYKKNKDIQKGKLYSWENRIDINFNKFSSLKDCTIFVNEVIKLINEREIFDNKFDINIDLKIDKKLKINSYAINNEIHLAPDWALNELTLIHEISHILTRNINKYNISNKIDILNVKSHGPEFCAIFISVLSIYYDINIDELLNSAKDYGLKVEHELLYKKEPINEFDTKRFK